MQPPDPTITGPPTAVGTGGTGSTTGAAAVPAAGPPAQPGQGNAPDALGGWTWPTTAPSGAGSSDVGAAVTQADAGVTAASAAYSDAKQALASAYSDYQAILNGGPAADPTGDKLKSVEGVLNNAQTNLARTVAAQDSAFARVNDAATRAAAVEKTPEIRNYYQQHADQAAAGAKLAQAQTAALNAKTPADIDNVRAQTTLALQQAKDAGVMTDAQAAQLAGQTQNLAAQTQQITTLLPFATRSAAAAAVTAESQAAVSPQMAQTALDQAQANVTQTKAAVDQIQAQINQLPTADQAAKANELGLAQKQTELDTAQQQLEQARKLMPIAVQQGQANVTQTGATTAATLATAQATAAATQKGQLGPLYGISDQISKLRDMIASGQVTAPDADKALNTFLNTQVTGATPFQIAQEQNTYNTNARAQNVGFAQSIAGDLTSAASGAQGTMAGLAAKSPAGYGQAFAQAYADSMNQLWQHYQSLTPAPAAPSATTQAPTVHINIGSGAPSSAPTAAAAPPPPAPPPPPAAAGINPAGPAIATSPAPPPLPPDATGAANPNWYQDFLARQGQSAGEQGLQATVQANNIDPVTGLPAFARGGIVTRPTVALVGDRGPEAIVPLGGPGAAMAPPGMHPSLASHPALAAAVSAIPGAASSHIDRSPWQQHVERWKNEIASGAVQVPKGGK